MHIKTERQCVACRNRFLKENLLRISNGSAGLIIDDKKKINGRGVYICKNNDCVNLAIKKKSLNRAFKTDISNDVYENLRGYIE